MPGNNDLFPIFSTTDQLAQLCFGGCQIDSALICSLWS